MDRTLSVRSNTSVDSFISASTGTGTPRGSVATLMLSEDEDGMFNAGAGTCAGSEVGSETGVLRHVLQQQPLRSHSDSVVTIGSSGADDDDDVMDGGGSRNSRSSHMHGHHLIHAAKGTGVGAGAGAGARGV
jgi:hypothetical protein